MDQTFLSKEVGEDISEGFSSHLCALLYPHLPCGLTTVGLADFSAFSSGVSVAATCDGPGQMLLSRNHVEPVPYNTSKGGGREVRGRKRGGGDSRCR